MNSLIFIVRNGSYGAALTCFHAHSPGNFRLYHAEWLGIESYIVRSIGWYSAKDMRDA